MANGFQQDRGKEEVQAKLDEYVAHLRKIVTTFNEHARELGLGVRLEADGAIKALQQGAGISRVMRFCDRVDAGDDETLLDPYAAEAPEEFFAVAAEAFFVAPHELKLEHAALYGLLARYFKQDPAARMAP